MMLLKSIVILVVTFNYFEALITIPLEWDEGYLKANVSVGTPAQLFKNVYVDFYAYDDFNVMVQSIEKCNNTGFNQTASLTFVELSRKKDEVYGTDVVNLGHGLAGIKNASLRISNYDEYCDHDTSIPLSNSPENNFIKDILATQEEKVAVLSYNEIGFNETNLGAILTLGGRPNNRCADDWEYITTGHYSTTTSWAFNVDRISAGKRSYATMLAAVMNIYQDFFYLTDEICGYFEDFLGIPLDKYLPCDDIHPVIYFKAGDVVLQLNPTDYMDYNIRNKDGYCYSKMYCGSDDNIIAFPISFLSTRCILYNYDYENSQIGLATRKE